MALLDKLKSLFGLGGSSAGQERRDTEVTVERDRTAADADTEEAVKGVDTSASDDATDDDATDDGDGATDAAVPDTNNATADEDAFAPDSDDEVTAEGETEADETAPGSAAIEPDAGSVGDAATEDDPGVSTEADEDGGEPGGETEADEDGGETEAATADETSAETDPAEQAPAAEGGHAGSTASMVDEGTDDGAVAEGSPDADESGDESAGASVDTVKGIGPAYAERLENADVHTVDELAAADPAEIAEATTVSEKRVERWIDRAREQTEE